MFDSFMCHRLKEKNMTRRHFLEYLCVIDYPPNPTKYIINKGIRLFFVEIFTLLNKRNENGRKHLISEKNELVADLPIRGPRLFFTFSNKIIW